MDSITVAVLSHRRAVLALGLTTALIAAAWGTRTMRLDADTDSLIGEQQSFMVDYRAFKRDFGDLEYLIVAVDAKPPGATSLRVSEATTAVRALVDELRSIAALRQVHGFITADEQLRLAPRAAAMSEADLAGLISASDAFPALLERRPGAEVLAEAERRLDALIAAPGASDARRTGAAAIFALQAIAAGAPVDTIDFRLAQELPPQWLTVKRGSDPIGRFLFVLLMPEKNYGTLAVIEEPLRQIREAIDRVRVQVPDIEIGLTGKPVLQADEMATTTIDMTRAAIVGLVLVALLFMAVFRGIRRPMLAVVTFAVGAAITYGAAALLVGRINLLSLVFMLVLVGVGLDYGIHMVARYTEGLRRLDRRSALRHMMRTAVPSNVTGAVIAGGTFLLALFTPFQGLRELGVIAGVGLLICAAVMMALLPVLLDLLDRGARAGPSFIEGGHLAEDAAPLRARHWAVMALALAGVCAVAIVAPSTVRFESNLLKLQADSVDAVKWEKRILADDASETWFGVSVVKGLAEIPPVFARAAKEPDIGATRSVLDLVAMPTPSRDALLAALGEATLSEASIARADARDDPQLDPGALRRCASKVDGLAVLAAVAAPDQAPTLRRLATNLRALADALDTVHHDAAMISARSLAVDDALRQTARSLVQMGIGARGSLRDALPAAVRDDFSSPNGLFCVRLHPARDVWEFEPMSEFVAALRRVDPHVTGVPITQFESMLLMERSFAIQGVLAAIFVTLILLLDLRSVRETLACVTTLAVGLAWTLGAMALFGVSFNLANFFAIPITLGLGSDACIHITHRAREGLSHGFGSTRRAVAVTSLTTVIGFGGLLFAQHRGLQSLGVLMVTATLMMLLSTTLLLPALLRLVARLRSMSTTAGLETRTAETP